MSLTSATFLFYQHEDVVWFDLETEQEQRGTNDPKLIFMVPSTVIYILINIPRILANGLLLAISPLLACIMLLFEFIMGLCLSHCFIRKIDSNIDIGGFLLAVTNAICPNAPLRKIGLLNAVSTIYTVGKLILLYPIVTYLSENEVFVRPFGKDPDLFRCYVNNTNSTKDMKTWAVGGIWTEIHSPRQCFGDETPNQLLFQLIIPILIGCLVFLTIPSGFAISYLMRQEKLDLYRKVLVDTFDCLTEPLMQSIRAMFCCFGGNSKSSTVNVEDTNVKVNTENKEEDNSFDAGEEKIGFKRSVITLDTEIEKPNIIFGNIRRVFSPPAFKSKTCTIFTVNKE